MSQAPSMRGPSVQYADLDILHYARAFDEWFRDLQHRIGSQQPPEASGVLGVAWDDLPPAFRPLASAITFSVRPLPDEHPDQATAAARIAVAAALATWLYRDRTSVVGG